MLNDKLPKGNEHGLFGIPKFIYSFLYNVILLYFLYQMIVLLNLMDYLLVKVLLNLSYLIASAFESISSNNCNSFNTTRKMFIYHQYCPGLMVVKSLYGSHLSNNSGN